MKNIAIALLSCFAASSAWAADPTPIDNTGRAVVEALKNFQKDEPAKANDFTGVKGWNEQGKHFHVKIYLTPATEFRQYHCHSHIMDGAEMMMCEQE